MELSVTNWNDCKKAFESQGDMNNHERTVHSIAPSTETKKRISCEFCNETFSFSSTLRKHQRGHHSVFQCGICEKKFESLGNLKHHEKHHYQCGSCDRYFASEQSLKNHRWRFHSEKTFTCPNCLKCFMFAKALRDHEEKKVCNEVKNCSHQQDQNESTFPCRNCHKTFQTDGNLKDHQKQQHSYCGLCDKLFANEPSLNEHKWRFHTKKRFKCPNCLGHFASAETLQNHQEKSSCKEAIRTRHRNGKNCVCNKCDAFFQCDEQLEHHMKLQHQSKSIMVNIDDGTLNIFPVKDTVNGKQKTWEKMEESYMQDDSTEKVLSSDPTDPTEEFNICSSDPTGKVDVEGSDPTENLKDHKKYHVRCDVCNKPFASGESMKDHRYEVHFVNNMHIYESKNMIINLDDDALEIFNELQPVNNPVTEIDMNENLKRSEKAEECHKQNDPTGKVIAGNTDNDMPNQNIPLISHHNHLLPPTVDSYRLPSSQPSFIQPETGSFNQTLQGPFVQPPQPYGHIQYGHQPMYDQQSYGQEPIYGQHHKYGQQQAYQQQIYGHQPVCDQQQKYQQDAFDKQHAYGQRQLYGQKEVHGQRGHDLQQTYGKQQAFR